MVLFQNVSSLLFIDRAQSMMSWRLYLRRLYESKHSFKVITCIFMYMAPKAYHTVGGFNSTVCSMFYCRSFENNLRTYKLLAHRKPESELPTVSHLTTC